MKASTTVPTPGYRHTFQVHRYHEPDKAARGLRECAAWLVKFGWTPAWGVRLTRSGGAWILMVDGPDPYPPEGL